MVAKNTKPTKDEILLAIDSCNDLINHVERLHDSIILRMKSPMESMLSRNEFNIERRADLRNAFYELRSAREALDTYARRWF
jgi:hypothetical protein